MSSPDEIRNISEITIEQAKKLKAQNINYVKIEDPRDYPVGRMYSPDDIIEIKKAIQEFLKGMPKFDKADPDYQKKVFTYVYVKLALMVKYDTKASKMADKPGYALDEKKGEYVNNAASLYGALINKRAICSGISEALRNILAELGIRAKYVAGGPNENGESHAWNQVCLDGVWYNCDATNDADFFRKGLIAKYFLVSDADYDLMQEYPPKHKIVPEKTKAKSLYPDEQWKLTCSILKAVKEELKQAKKRPEYVTDISNKANQKKTQRGE